MFKFLIFISTKSLMVDDMACTMIRKTFGYIFASFGWLTLQEAIDAFTS